MIEWLTGDFVETHFVICAKSFACTAIRFEKQLDDLFTKNTPRLPDSGRKTLAAWAPVVTLILGILSLIAAWELWHWAHVADSLLNYANAVCNTYSGYTCGVNVSRFSLWLWLGVAFLIAEGILYLFAYPGLRDHRKEGWNYIYYALCLQVVYAVLSLFIPYDKGSHFLGSLIESVVGFYLLFQIRGIYSADKADRQTPKSTHHGKD